MARKGFWDVVIFLWQIRLLTPPPPVCDICHKKVGVFFKGSLGHLTVTKQTFHHSWLLHHILKYYALRSMSIPDRHTGLLLEVLSDLKILVRITTSYGKQKWKSEYVYFQMTILRHHLCKPENIVWVTLTSKPPGLLNNPAPNQFIKTRFQYTPIKFIVVEIWPLT